MFYGKLLRLLSLFHVVLQIRASFVADKDFVAEKLLKFNAPSDYKGLDVTSYEQPKRNRVCHLGSENPPLLFSVVDDENQYFEIQVKLDKIEANVVRSTYSLQESQPWGTTIDTIFPSVGRTTPVIYCGFNDEQQRSYYFGRGPNEKSIAVYFVKQGENQAEIAGMFFEIDENSI